MFIEVSTGAAEDKRTINCFRIAYVYPVKVDQPKAYWVRSGIMIARGDTLYVREDYDTLKAMIGDATNAR